MSSQKPVQPSRIPPWLASVVTAIGFILFIALPIWQAALFWNSSDANFRPSFVGNWAATVLGIIGGIPVALALNRLWQHNQERVEKEKADRERDLRESFVLHAIRDELQMNRDIIYQMLDDQAKRPTIVATKGMKDVNWKALSDSGELKWIDDLTILLSISEAYFHIGVLIYLERQYLDLSSYTRPVDQGARGNIAVQRVHVIRPDALVRVKEAIRVIDLKIGSDIVHSYSTTGLPKSFEA